MSNERSEQLRDLPPRIQRAVDELRGMILRRYPTASFAVARAADEPENVHLTAVVDVEDTDEVLDLVIDRVVQLQVEEGVPVHVIPIRTPVRVLAELKAPTPAIRALPGIGRGH
ncbi:MAG: hypothetical protein ACRDIY_24200 [Chloroflexota bacterium]